MKQKMADSCCYFKCQITSFPEHILPKMSIFWWELRILSGLQVTHQKSYDVIFFFLHAILEAGITEKNLHLYGAKLALFLATFQQE